MLKVNPLMTHSFSKRAFINYFLRSATSVKPAIPSPIRLIRQVLKSNPLMTHSFSNNKKRSPLVFTSELHQEDDSGYPVIFQFIKVYHVIDNLFP